MSNKILACGLTITTMIFMPQIVGAEQVIIQRGSTRATAEGKNNSASSGVHQSSRQNRFGNPNSYFHNQNQTSTQQGQSNSTAVGENNTVTNYINQSSVQDQYDNSNSPHQSSTQNATSNGTAIGQNNSVTGNIEQTNDQ